MEGKLFILAVLLLGLVAHHQVNAEFGFWPTLPKAGELEQLGLGCVPGRTVIKVENEKKPLQMDDDKSSYEDGRRTHMNFLPKGETCRICICSVEGKDEYCSVRPAKNVNECLRMSKLMDDFQQNLPYNHEKTLSYMIRRDYLWHHDELPYKANAKCERGVSYYSNSLNANDTDIDVPSGVESLLEYNNRDVCFYCVCSVSGEAAGCIHRDPWYCEYYRFLRNENAARDLYTDVFKEDRPTYFRTLSYRLRRAMDNGIYTLLENAGSGLDKASCVPFVSEYTDCTEANQCSGCSRCSCTAEGKWSCIRVDDCPSQEYTPVDDNKLDNALNELYSELKRKDQSKPVNPRSAESSEDLTLGNKDKIEQKLISLLTRRKRSAKLRPVKSEPKLNDTIKFYHTVDEINEDTLKNTNMSGTLHAAKMKVVIPKQISRRSGGLLTNSSSDSPLQIEYKQVYNHHIADNKKDVTTPGEHNVNLLDHDVIHGINTNHTQIEKNKEISKLIVNELKTGSEIIGDKYAPIMSNITFTPENDTLTAMAYIAGNLLNKLWSMEKDGSDESEEREALKQEKIADLLDLFKEPLTLRQEGFLKNALEKLSESLDKNKNVSNVSLCEHIIEAKKVLQESSNENSRRTNKPTEAYENSNKTLIPNITKNHVEENRNVTAEAIIKINEVLSLIKKFEGVNKHINDLKRQSKNDPKNKLNYLKKNESPENYVPSEEVSTNMNIFGTVLEKITKLLLPKKHSKKMINKIKGSSNIFRNTVDIKKQLKETYNVDLGDLVVSTKDKLVLDYLARIHSSPNCLLDENISYANIKQIPKVEGDILLNLSEFLKIKSFADLLKLLEPVKSDEHNKLPTRSPPTTSPIVVTPKVYESITVASNNSSSKLASTKEKLKAHLKTILNDLVELQKEKGISKKEGEIRIAEALPCIYNILNADEKVQKKVTEDEPHPKTLENISAVFDSLKKELKFASQSRRSNLNNKERTKAVIVWERIIKQLDDNEKRKSRRNTDKKSAKSLNDLKKTIDLVESLSSNSYKVFAALNGVPSAERMVLLKTLEVEVKKYIRLLESTKLSLESLSSTSNENQTEIWNFVENANNNLNLSEKLINSLNKLNSKNNLRISTVRPKANVEVINPKINNVNSNYKEEIRMHEVNPLNDYNNFKITKDTILKQLIKNRVRQYMELKEEKESDPTDDINYNLAKNILKSLERGNYNLAKELYKVFVSNKSQKSEHNANYKTPALATPPVASARRQMTFNKVPLIKFEDPKTPSDHMISNTQRQMLHQFLNLKRMKI